MKALTVEKGTIDSQHSEHSKHSALVAECSESIPNTPNDIKKYRIEFWEVFRMFGIRLRAKRNAP